MDDLNVKYGGALVGYDGAPTLHTVDRR